jgi:hypothetical protein
MCPGNHDPVQNADLNHDSYQGDNSEPAPCLQGHRLSSLADRRTDRGCRSITAATTIGAPRRTGER